MNSSVTMHLEVVAPAATVVDALATKVRAEAPNGNFTLLPRHIDFVASLVPGLLSYVSDGQERMVAVDGGTLVKRGLSVRVATRGATPGDSVADLQQALRLSFEELAEGEQRSRVALARLETDAIRRLIELSEDE